MNALTKKLSVILATLLLWGAFSPLAASAAQGEEAPFFAYASAGSGDIAAEGAAEADEDAPPPPAEPDEGPPPEDIPAEEAPPAGGQTPEPPDDDAPPAEDPPEGPSNGAPEDSPPEDADGPAGPQADAPEAQPPETAGPISVPDGAEACGSAEELLRLINDEGAGRIFLTDDIEWDFGPERPLTPGRPTSVAMDGRVLRISAGASLTVKGPLRFEGDGQGRPLVTVEGGFRGEQVEIAANGEGAVALCLEPTADWASDWMELSAQGPGAVALRVNGPHTDFNSFSVSARGEGAVGILAGGPLELYCSSVVSDGESILCVGGLLLDACRAEPLPEGAEVVRRRAVPPDRVEQIGYSVTVGTPWEEVENRFLLREGVPDAISYDLYDREGRSHSTSVSIPVVYGGVPIDCSAAGSHTVSARPLPLPDWFPVEIPAFTAPFHVVDPGVPWISGAFLTAEGGLHLIFLEPIAGADRMLLEYSAGGAWRDARGLPHCEIRPESADLMGLKADRYYHFRLTVVGGPMAGVSNTLEFPLTTGDPSQIGGGDRDDDDRGEQGELPQDNVIAAPGGGQNGEGPPARPQKSASAQSMAAGAVESQAPPAPPSPPAAANLALTASELAAQRKANPEGITLIGEGIRATLPAALLDALPAGEPLYAQLETPEAGRFIVRFWSGTREAGAFDTPFLVGVDYVPKDPSSETACTNGAGEPVHASGREGNRWNYELAGTGEYRIMELPSTKRQETSAPAALPDPGAAEAAAPAGPGAVPEEVSPTHWPAALLLAGLAAALVLLRRRGGGPLG